MALMHSRFLVTLALGLGVTTHAAGHAPPVVLQVIELAPLATILATNRGLVFGDAARAQWSLLCSEAFGVSTGVPYAALKLPSGRLVIAHDSGLRVSDDLGCSWRATPGLGALTPRALAQHPDLPGRMYVAVDAPGAGGIRRSDDGGDSFETLLAVADDERIGSLLVAPGEPERLYAAITQLGTGTAFRAFVARSRDGGKSWQRTEIALRAKAARDAGERDVTLLAVNPAQPDELLVRVNAGEPVTGERIGISRDGGERFDFPAELPAVTGATFSRDGAIAYVGCLDGLYLARGPDRSFAPIPETYRISTVVEHADALLVGGYYAGLEAGYDGLGQAARDASPLRFETVMNFDQVRSQVTCPAPSTASADCAALWFDWQTEMGQLVTTSPPADAGAPDAATADAPVSRSSRDGCALGQTSSQPAWPLVLVALLAWLRRRTVSRRTP